MKIVAAPILLALALATPAVAQSSGPMAPGMGQPTVSMEEARQIAASAGIATIEEIEMDDGKWEIEGRNSAGQEMDIDIDAMTGRVVSMDMDDDDDTRGTVGQAPAGRM